MPEADAHVVVQRLSGVVQQSGNQHIGVPAAARPQALADIQAVPLVGWRHDEKEGRQAGAKQFASLRPLAIGYVRPQGTKELLTPV